MLLPVVCPCGASLGASVPSNRPPSVPCDDCRARFRRPSTVAVDGVDEAVTAGVYRDTSATLVASVKYGRGRVALPWLAGELAGLVRARPRWRLDVATGRAVVTWVPTTRARRRRRGFDQSRLLAAALARDLGIPCRPLLRRLGGPPQTGRSADERRLGPALVSCGHPRAPVVILVDDVVTTGATLAAAAAATRAAGAREVRALALARTPRRRGIHPPPEASY